MSDADYLIRRTEENVLGAIGDIGTATKPSDFADIAETWNLDVDFVLSLADYFAANLLGDRDTL